MYPVMRYCKHGLSRTPEYRAWQTMRLRCTVPTNPAYHDYGGRGITVCDRWLNSVETFVADMGPKPTPNHELDRIDNSKGYSPENCRWVTRDVNSRNRRSNHWVTWRGRRMTVIEAIELSGVNEHAAHKRLAAGWSVEKTFETPVRRKAKNGQRKVAPRRANRHGFKGVFKGPSRFYARIKLGSRYIHSPGCVTAEEAHAWYLETKAKIKAAAVSQQEDIIQQLLMPRYAGSN